MAVPIRQFSLDQHLSERMKFSGSDQDHPNDLISIVVGLKNKYGIVPLAATPRGHRFPTGQRLATFSKDSP
jgi:hypothetical protein